MKRKWAVLIFVGVAIFHGVLAHAEVRVPALFSDHMVLQRQRPVRIWGWADAGEVIQVEIAGHRATTRADEGGQWLVFLEPMEAGGPYILEIQGQNRLSFDDVLIGEVWLASGQSNMEWPLISAKNAEREVLGATTPQIRLFTVDKAINLNPVDDVVGRWVRCSPATAGSFSAVAYFFGRSLYEELGVPIGLIQSAWGGTPAEAWTSRQALIAHPGLRGVVEQLDERLASPEKKRAAEQELAEWEKNNLATDPGNRGFAAGYAEPAFDDTSWEEMELPQGWERAGLECDGAVWFRRHVIIPEAWAGENLQLSLGPIDDFDATYFAGVQVGATGHETPGYWAVPRSYEVAGTQVRPGPTVIAVRVFDQAGEGGLVGSPAQLELKPVAGDSAPISLAGKWRYKVEHAMGPLTPDWGSRPSSIFDQRSPTALYNAMIAPLVRWTIRGAIWYQGEDDAARAYRYRLQFPVMIRDWRDRFELGGFPFYFVQLANYMERQEQPGPSAWAELREAQLWTLALPNTGMAVAIDIGEADDIHPTNKQDVGRRLALWALAKTYGREVPYSGPLYWSHTVEAHQIRVEFDHADGLAAHDGRNLRGFAIAGEDRRFVWADAVVDGRAVLVTSEDVPHPVAVRYGWADNPDCNLVNGANLPASPFRTDSWPGSTWTR